jgi:hypothetical protein
MRLIDASQQFDIGASVALRNSALDQLIALSCV